MKDGRYKSQKNKMLDWKKHFTHSNVETKLIYLVEGRTKQFNAKCGHGCTSQCGWPKITDLEVTLPYIL